MVNAILGEAWSRKPSQPKCYDAVSAGASILGMQREISIEQPSISLVGGTGPPYSYQVTRAGMGNGYDQG